jgi:hypothetical protein
VGRACELTWRACLNPAPPPHTSLFRQRFPPEANIQTTHVRFTTERSHRPAPNCSVQHTTFRSRSPCHAPPSAARSHTTPARHLDRPVRVHCSSAYNTIFGEFASFRNPFVGRSQGPLSRSYDDQGVRPIYRTSRQPTVPVQGTRKGGRGRTRRRKRNTSTVPGEHRGAYGPGRQLHLDSCSTRLTHLFPTRSLMAGTPAD